MHHVAPGINIPPPPLLIFFTILHQSNQVNVVIFQFFSQFLMLLKYPCKGTFLSEDTDAL